MQRLLPRGKFWRFAAVSAAISLASTQLARSSPQEVTRRDWGIGNFKPPPRWEMQEQDRPSYPQLLAWASRGQEAGRSVMTLVGKRLTPGTSVETFAGLNGGRKDFSGLQQVHRHSQAVEGWSGHRVQLDGILAGLPQRVVRQLFYVNGAIGYVLTLVAPPDQALAQERDLEDTAAGLVPVPVDPAARPAAPMPPPPEPPATLTPATPSERPR